MRGPVRYIHQEVWGLAAPVVCWTERGSIIAQEQGGRQGVNDVPLFPLFPHERAIYIAEPPPPPSVEGYNLESKRCVNTLRRIKLSGRRNGQILLSCPSRPPRF